MVGQLREEGKYLGKVDYRRLTLGVEVVSRLLFSGSLGCGGDALHLEAPSEPLPAAGYESIP